MDFTKLWNVRYLFGPNPLDLSRSDIIFFWSAAGFLLLAIVAKIAVLRQEPDSPQEFLFGRLFHLFLTTGALALLWMGLRFENIPWLSTHILVLAAYLMFLVWLGFIATYLFLKFPAQQRQWMEEKTKRKYLPR